MKAQIKKAIVIMLALVMTISIVPVTKVKAAKTYKYDGEYFWQDLEARDWVSIKIEPYSDFDSSKGETGYCCTMNIPFEGETSFILKSTSKKNVYKGKFTSDSIFKTKYTITLKAVSNRKIKVTMTSGSGNSKHYWYNNIPVVLQKRYDYTYSG